MAILKINNVVSVRDGSDDVIKNNLSREIVVGVVGPAGAGCSRVSGSLKSAFEAVGYFCVIIKVGSLIQDHKVSMDFKFSDIDKIQKRILLQDKGDEIRKLDISGTARLILKKIVSERASLDDEKRSGRVAYIVDSLKHPAEVGILRSVYRKAFALIGSYAPPKHRKARILNLIPRADHQKSMDLVDSFIARDNEDKRNDYGQKVSKAFHLSDYFIDTAGLTDENGDDVEHGDTRLNEELYRVIKIIEGDGVIRPTKAEFAMHAAASAQKGSACLSRQVGAALVDDKGNVVSVGTNEVPMFGGGTYAAPIGSDMGYDNRCVNRSGERFCSSNRQQLEMINDITGELKANFPELSGREEEIKKIIRSSRVGSLIEFSRAVHAEMDAILAASRSGANLVGSSLYVTTYPCHYCARHIIAAGVKEVFYIEPYPKSLALELHKDSIFDEGIGLDSQRDRKVLFKPFSGVAPRFYAQAFEKDRKYKNEDGDYDVGKPLYGNGWAQSLVSYLELEKQLTND